MSRAMTYVMSQPIHFFFFSLLLAKVTRTYTLVNLGYLFFLFSFSYPFPRGLWLPWWLVVVHEM